MKPLLLGQTWIALYRYHIVVRWLKPYTYILPHSGSGRHIIMISFETHFKLTCQTTCNNLSGTSPARRRDIQPHFVWHTKIHAQWEGRIFDDASDKERFQTISKTGKWMLNSTAWVGTLENLHFRMRFVESLLDSRSTPVSTKNVVRGKGSGVEMHLKIFFAAVYVRYDENLTHCRIVALMKYDKFLSPLACVFHNQHLFFTITL